MAEQGRHFYIEWLVLMTKYSNEYWNRKSDEELEKAYYKVFEGRDE